MRKVGICFSREFEDINPLGHIGIKYPVYIRLLEFCQDKGWQVYVLTRRTYKGEGIFEGSWLFSNGKFKQVFEKVHIDLVYDRTGGVIFPPARDKNVIFVNRRDFKIFCWDKWMAFRKIGKYMPETFWVGEKNNLENALSQIKTDWVVLKPFNGLKGVGVFIGPRNEASSFRFVGKNPKYIAQEFLDTSLGIPGITDGLHDLRIAIINGKAVWAHVRVPPKGSFKANAAAGGILSEVDYGLVPSTVKKIVEEISKLFYRKYDNPIFSLDFGIGKDSVPKIFEINDQIGFPRWEMKQKDEFLKELVENFEEKIKG